MYFVRLSQDYAGTIDESLRERFDPPVRRRIIVASI